MERKIVYEGRRIKVGTISVPQRNGQPVQKDLVVHPGAAVVLPMLDGDRICLIRNMRHTLGEELIEVVAGTLEPPEPPEACAIREVAEETGYRAARVTKLAEFYSSPGVLSEKMYLFVAEGLVEGEQHLDAGEEIQATRRALERGGALGDRRHHPRRQEHRRHPPLRREEAVERGVSGRLGPRRPWTRARRRPSPPAQ